ncbi:hypothetical protein SGPA1_50283 [Streptomyces misionensis JCM 4497]
MERHPPRRDDPAGRSAHRPQRGGHLTDVRHDRAHAGQRRRRQHGPAVERHPPRRGAVDRPVDDAQRQDRYVPGLQPGQPGPRRLQRPRHRPPVGPGRRQGHRPHLLGHPGRPHPRQVARVPPPPLLRPAVRPLIGQLPRFLTDLAPQGRQPCYPWP